MQENNSCPPKAVRKSLYEHEMVRLACRTYVVQPQFLFTSITNGVADAPAYLVKTDLSVFLQYKKEN